MFLPLLFLIELSVSPRLLQSFLAVIVFIGVIAFLLNAAGAISLSVTFVVVVLVFVVIIGKC